MSLKADPVRVERMCCLYRAGHTLQQIGTVYGLTRERVRQIVTRAGVTKHEGGVARRKKTRIAARKAAKQIKRDAMALEFFGCSHAELLALNGGKGGWVKGTLAHAYCSQRRNALARGIEFCITLPEWLQAWEQSGHLSARGRTGAGYVMARRQDYGPYAPWNVYITTLAQNVSDYQAELKRRGVACADGYKRLPERAKARAAA